MYDPLSSTFGEDTPPPWPTTPRTPNTPIPNLPRPSRPVTPVTPDKAADAAVAGAAPRGEDVVGAGGVVAERDRGVRPDEDRSGVAHPVGPHGRLVGDDEGVLTKRLSDHTYTAETTHLALLSSSSTADSCHWHTALGGHKSLCC